MKIFLLSFYTLFLFSCAVTNIHTANDFKKWDKNDPLKWKDFKAMPPYSELPAVTQWGLSLKMSDTPRDVHAYFYKPKSWCRTGDKGSWNTSNTILTLQKYMPGR